MSGDKNPHTPSGPSVREAAIKLLATMDREGDAMYEGTEAYATALAEQTKAQNALRDALQAVEPRAYEPWSIEAETWIDAVYRQPYFTREHMIAAYMAGRFAQSRTRPAPIERMDLALEGIALIKRSAPPGELTPDHVLAVVSAAEHVLEAFAGYGLRWEADMRAIERWQAGQPSPAVQALIDAAGGLAGQVMRMQELGPVDHDLASASDRVQALLEDGNGDATPAGRRGLIWPDHADLVVWLLELVHRRPAVPALAEVEGVRNRLRSAIVASGGNRLAIYAKKMIDALVEVALWADRRAFMAETALTQERGNAAGGMNGRLHLVASSVSPVGDVGQGSREQSFSGDGPPAPPEGPCGHYPIEPHSGCDEILLDGASAAGFGPAEPEDGDEPGE